MVEIRKSKLSRLWQVAIPAFAIVALSFSASLLAGFIALAAAAVLGIMFAPNIREFVARAPVAVTIRDDGLYFTFTPYPVIPWQEIEETALYYGGRGGTTRLCVRVSDPHKYLGAFQRFNLSLSRFHIFVPVSELEYSAEQVLRMVQDAKRAHA